MKIIALSFAFLLATTGAHAQTLQLRDAVTVRGSTITLADLIEGAPEGPPLFMAPAPGVTGTIRTARIKEAALQAGITDFDARALPHVAVTRASRKIDAAAMSDDVRTALATKLGIAPAQLDVSFDTAPDVTALLLPQDGALVADLAVDTNTRRFSVTLDPTRVIRERPVVTGRYREIVELAVLKRAVARGETITADHITIERRGRNEVADAISHSAALGLVAKNALSAGQALRQSDLGKPILVERNSIVTLTFQTPGMALQLRGRAQDQGALGDAISVLNPVSKKIVVGVVTGPGRAIVNPEQQEATP